MPEPFPGVATDDDLKNAFRIVNDWAKSLKEWETRIRAMCGIVEVQLNLGQGQFDGVLAKVKGREHSKHDIREALAAGVTGGGGIGGATDIIGNPPEPPFKDGTI